MGVFENLLYQATRKSRFLAYHSSFAVTRPTDWGTIRVPIICGNTPFFVHGEWFTNLLRRIYAVEAGAFLDVGVNYAQSLYAKLRVDREHGYLGFEPQVDCVAYAEKFISMNGLAGNHFVLPAGAAKDWRVAQLFMAHTLESATATPGVRSDEWCTRKKNIVITRGDTVMDVVDIGPVSILKIDVEGGELEVVQGFEETIRKHKPWIIFEILSPRTVYNDETRRSGTDQKELYERLLDRANTLISTIQGHGYSLEQVMPNDRRKPVAHLEDASNDFGPIWNFVAQPDGKPALAP